MNTKRIIFWVGFIIILALIVWGLVAAMNKPVPGMTLGDPAAVTSADHVRGPADAPVTLIEYGDFQCPACAVYFSLVERIMNESSTTVRLVFRHFPLTQHQNAIPAAIASEAAGKQGKFWEMYKLLYENQSEWSDAPSAETIFEKYGSQIGLNMTQYKLDEKDSSLLAPINAGQDEGNKIGVNATPTFFLNGKAIVNPNGYEAFKALIDSAAR